MLITLSILTLPLLALKFTAAGQSSPSPLVYGSSDWTNWANTAWKYYQPNVGVNPFTGLHQATLTWGCFADWDLGSYIYAIIFARKLGLITDGSGSDWNFNGRINRILNFLQNRPLGSGTWPILAYRSDSLPGTACPGDESQVTNAADSGRLLAALYALKSFRPTYAATVNAIYARSKSAYDTMGSYSLVGDYYRYEAAEGFAAFGYDKSNAFNSIDEYSGSYVQSGYGQSLPVVGTVAEPINHILLEIDTLMHQPSSLFIDFAGRVMQAQQGRYFNTGKLTAWSEGGYAPDPAYIYEVIVDKDNQGNFLGTWRLKLGDTVYDQETHPPLAYTKVAFAYLALYGENAYTVAMVNAAKNLASPSSGFGEAMFESNGQPAYSGGGFYSDKTNEFVLAAAYRVLNSPQTSTTTITSTTTSFQTNSTSIAISEYKSSYMLLVATFTALLSILIIRRYSNKRKDRHET